MKMMFDRLGMTWPTYADWIIGGAALAITVGVWLLAHLIGRWLGVRLARFWSVRLCRLPAASAISRRRPLPGAESVMERTSIIIAVPELMRGSPAHSAPFEAGL